MNKFNPKAVPHWVRWIAQDKDGKWWGYKTKPKAGYTLWIPKSINMCKGLYTSKPSKNWREELYKWDYI